VMYFVFFFFSSRRRHTRFSRDWSSDVCSSDLSFPRATLSARGISSNLLAQGYRAIGTHWLSGPWMARAAGYRPNHSARHPPAEQIGRASCRERAEEPVGTEGGRKKGERHGGER